MRPIKVWAVNEYQKTFDELLKWWIRGAVAMYALGFLKFLPDSLSNKIMDKLLKMIGLG
jgi:hypothetical protein